MNIDTLQGAAMRLRAESREQEGLWRTERCCVPISGAIKVDPSEGSKGQAELVEGDSQVSQRPKLSAFRES